MGRMVHRRGRIPCECFPVGLPSTFVWLEMHSPEISYFAPPENSGSSDETFRLNNRHCRTHAHGRIGSSYRTLQYRCCSTDCERDPGGEVRYDTGGVARTAS